MGRPYKIIISSNSIHREFEIHEDMEKVSLGTNPSCEFRLDADDFFAPVELAFLIKDGQWYVLCDENLYLSFDDVRKLRYNKIDHGDSFQVKYSNNGAVVFDVFFSINFEVQIPSYNRRIDIPDSVSHIKIGSGSFSPEIELKSKYCDNTLAVIRLEGSKYVLEERQSSYGVNVNGKRISQPVELKNHDFFSISDVFFYLKDGSLYTDFYKTGVRNLQTTLVEHSTFKYPVFVRNTRRKIELDKTPIKILDPSQKPKKPELNLVTSLLPMVLMLVMIVVVRGFIMSSGGGFIIFSACSMGIGLVTSVISMIQGQKKYKKDIAERERVYKKYIEEKEAEITKAREKELGVLNELYIGQATSIQKVLDFDSDIFDRIPEDDDYMDVILGYGRRKAERIIDYKKQEKLEENDELAMIPEQVDKKFRYIENAPVTISLRTANAVGVTGNKTERYEFFKSILADLICRQFNNEMEFFLLLGDDVESFDWIKRLPQLQRNDGKRNIVYNSNTRTSTFDYLYKELSLRSKSETVTGKNLIVFTLDNNGIYNHPISKYIQNAAILNTTFVFFESSVDYLPLYCSEVIELNGESGGKCYRSSNRIEDQKFTYSHISDETMEALVERIAPVYSEEISLASSLRKNYSVYEMLGIYNADDIDVENNWNSSDVCKSMAAPIGINSKDEIVMLDLHEKAHGPHGLVAGTTGSGKSEILQTFILSMAVKFHPYEVSFVIIDFKGGGMANQLAGLPHLVGTITNIDGKEIDRSLKSIKAELLKRQALFAEAGVNHIDKYISAFKAKKVSTPLPHLIIIVDEFAELKAEQPEFMKELISASRIGRSLGVHLILATQKPSGQVSDQIWSNSRFKLCLKVQDQQDSNEVIKSPVAAEIKEPGRAYLQVGNNEIFELLQSGYSGGPAFRGGVEDKPFRIFSRDLAGREDVFYQYIPAKTETTPETELEAIIKRIESQFSAKEIKKLPDICLPPLPAVIDFPKKAYRSNTPETIVEIGLLDDPNNQLQIPAYLNFTQDNVMMIGSSQYGKTNMLQLIIRGLCSGYSPDEVNIYIMDFGSMILKNLESLKHVGGVVIPNEDEKFKNLMKLLLSEIEERKEKMLKAGVSSFSSYREAGYTDIPQIVFLIDNYTAVKEYYLQEEDPIMQICRDGLSVGISTVIANTQTSGMGYRYMSNFSKRIVFYCNESGEYSNVIEKCRTAPDNVPGRVLTEINKQIYELQTYLSFHGDKEVERIAAMRDFVEVVNAMTSGQAKRIPTVPDVLYLEDLNNDFGYNCKNTYVVPIGLNYDPIEPVAVDLVKQGWFVINGASDTDRNNFVRLIFDHLYRNMFSCPSEIYVLDAIDRKLAPFKSHGLVEKYSIDATDIIEYIEETYSEISDRYRQYSTDELDLDNEPLKLIVIRNEDALEILSKNTAAMKEFNELIGRLKGMKVCFVLMDVPNSAVGYSSPEILKTIKESKRMFYLDDLQNMKMIDISVATLRKFRKKLARGDAYWLTGNEISKIKIIKWEE